ncbi:13712_t:CDS:2, partial [Gigaspora margarita]
IYIAEETAPANITDTTVPSQIDFNTRAYIDSSANAIVNSIKSYIDQNISIQMNMISKLNERLDIYMNQQQIQDIQKKNKALITIPGHNHDYDPATTVGSSTMNQKKAQLQQ